MTIGLIDTFDPDFYLSTYVPTITYLQKQLPQYHFVMQEIDHRTVLADIDRQRPDFLVSSASQFVALINTRGAQQIVTKKRAGAKDVSHSVASTVIVRSDRSDLKKLNDLKGKTIAATDPLDFDGWAIALYEITKQGFDPDTFFSKTIFSHYQFPSVASLVKVGQVDAGILSTCVYEELLQDGSIDSSSFRILNPLGSKEYCVRSTDRFPDVVFSSFPRVSSGIVKNMTLALLSMPPVEQNFEWLPARGFLETFDLLKALRTGPYEHLRETTLNDFVRAHWNEFLLAFALLLAVLVHTVRVNFLVRKRTQELQIAEKQRREAEKRALDNRKKLDVLEKTRAISQMSSLFAHEVKQPITNIIYYVSGLKLLLAQVNVHEPLIDSAIGKLAQQAQRTAQIVDHVRSYAKQQPKTVQCCDLYLIAQSALHSLHAEEKFGLNFEFRAQPNALIMADSFEIELVVLNLLKNAFAAVKNISVASVVLSINSLDNQWCLTVADNGPTIDQSLFQTLGRPLQSQKHEGLGIGLSIAHDIIESHGGHLLFKRNSPCGLQVSFVLLKASLQETK